MRVPRYKREYDNDDNEIWRDVEDGRVLFGLGCDPVVCAPWEVAALESELEWALVLERVMVADAASVSSLVRTVYDPARWEVRIGLQFFFWDGGWHDCPAYVREKIKEALA